MVDKEILQPVVIFNLNIRFESPVLNMKLRKLVNNNNVVVYLVGFVSNFNYDFIHLSVFFNFDIFLLIRS